MRVAFWVFLFFSLSAWAQENGPLPIDWQHLKADLRFEPTVKKVYGQVELTFALEEELDSAFVHGFKLQISNVELNGQPIALREAEEQRLYFPTTFCKPNKANTLAIEYHAHPTMGLFFAGWDDTTQTHVRQIYTHGQGNWHRRWIPLYDFPDDKYSTELIVSVDSAFEVLANGELKEVKATGSEKKWHYVQEKPFPPYVMALAVGKYNKTSIETKSGVAIDQYSYMDWHKDFVLAYYRDTKNMFEFIENDIGFSYPWGPYSIIPVSDYTYGGMENTGVSFVNDRYYGQSYEEFLRVNAHEMAHQWFGNCLTAENDTHHWIQEGFATYYEWISNAEVLGEEWFLKKLFHSEQMIIDAAFEDSLPLADPTGSFERHYLRGAFTVHMLRQQIGDRAFSKGLKKLFKERRFGWANSSEVLAAFQGYTDRDLDVFRRQWVEKPGAPIFRMGVVTGENGRLVAMESVMVRDWHDPKYDMLIPIDFFNGSEQISSVSLRVKDGVGSIQLPENATHFEVDPENHVLAYIIDLSPVEMRFNAALYSDNPIIVYDKTERLVARQELLSTDTALIKRLMNHHSAITRELVVAPILKSEILDANRVILHFLKDPSEGVVMEAIRAIDDWTEEMDEVATQILTGPNRKTVKEALLIRKYAVTGDDHTLHLWDSFSEKYGGLIRIRFLAAAYEHPDIFDRDAVRYELEYFCSPAANSYERELAFQVALDWGEFNPTIVKHGKNARTNSARQLRQKAKSFIKEMENRFPEQF